MTARAAAPRPGVFAGTLGVKVPKGGHARVRAIDAASSVVVAAKDVGRSGAFSLRLPAGAYVVRGLVLPRRGPLVTKATAVSLKPGQRRTGTKLTARKKTKKKRARAAYVTERGNVRLGSVGVGIYPSRSPARPRPVISQRGPAALTTCSSTTSWRPPRNAARVT
jgi:hypothetical protein